MKYKWIPQPNDPPFSFGDGSGWRIGKLPNGCTVFWGIDGWGECSATCTRHGVLPLGANNNISHAWSACQQHKRQNEDGDEHHAV